MTKHTVSVTHFDHCFSDYVTDWSGFVVGVQGSGQTAAEMAADVVRESQLCGSDLPDDIADEALRAAVLEALDPTARFWPTDDHGNELNTDANPDANPPEEQPSYWFRLYVETE